jgi:hypothetical protein
VSQHRFDLAGCWTALLKGYVTAYANMGSARAFSTAWNSFGQLQRRTQRSPLLAINLSQRNLSKDWAVCHFRRHFG